MTTPNADGPRRIGPGDDLTDVFGRPREDAYRIHAATESTGIVPQGSPAQVPATHHSTAQPPTAQAPAWQPPPAQAPQPAAGPPNASGEATSQHPNASRPQHGPASEPVYDVASASAFPAPTEVWGAPSRDGATPPPVYPAGGPPPQGVTAAPMGAPPPAASGPARVRFDAGPVAGRRCTAWAVVLGVLALVCACIPIPGINVAYAGVAAIASIVVAIVAFAREAPGRARWLALFGGVLGVGGTATAMPMAVFYLRVWGDLVPDDEPESVPDAAMSLASVASVPFAADADPVAGVLALAGELAASLGWPL